MPDGDYVLENFNAYDAEGIIKILSALQSNDGTENIDIDPNTTFTALRNSFAEAQYEGVAKFFGLVGDEEEPFKEWKDIDVPLVVLPMSVIEKVVMRTMESFVREPATGLFRGGAFQSLVSLFGGILQYRPEHTASGTDFSSGEEAAIFCHDEMLFFVREFKNRRRSERKKFIKALAQVLCELFGVWHLNRRKKEDIDPTMLIPVHACLYDATDFYFLSYDGFGFRKRIFRNSVAPQTGGRDVQDYVYETLRVHMYTFALLLEGYNSAVTLQYERSVRRNLLLGPNVGRGACRDTGHSTTTASGWRTACRLAYESRAFFQRAQEVHSNEPAEKGLRRLAESVEVWSPAQGGGGVIHLRVLLPPQVKAMAELVAKRHERSLQADYDLKWVPPHFLGVESATVQERKNRATDAFWAGLHRSFRTLFEPMMLFKGDTFLGLSVAAHEPREYQAIFEKRAPRFMALVLIKKLEESQQEGNWVEDWE
ncbi:hypothetical protein B0H11DRAFT_2189617 [Mycena galericulata]|nr:hypothetical protein B0H11DRAFT_2189617 [Mycena galericulata]